MGLEFELIVDKVPLKIKGTIKSLNSLKIKDGTDQKMLLITSDTAENIHLYGRKDDESQVKPIVTIPKEFESPIGKARLEYPGGVIHMENAYHIMDGCKKVLYRYDTKGLTPRISLLPHINSPVASILNSPHSIITDTVFDNNKIWFTCVAGYSSSVCCYDLKNNILEHKNFTRGSKPTGLTFANDFSRYFVLDASNRQISGFDISGKWDGTKENLRIENKRIAPIGITMDRNGKLMVAADKLSFFNTGRIPVVKEGK